MSVKSAKKVYFPLINSHACGIDVGSRSHWVCVGPGQKDVREFKVFTEDLHELCRWLQSYNVETVAMESTGFYWKSLFLLLQSYGFEVFLVNARHTKNMRGKKTDISDCQWIWQLHCAGLLTNSFQPDDFTEELRTYVRQRKYLIKGATRYIAKMQKSMVLMNVHLSVVLSDITGKSGLRIINAILSGQRNGEALAKLADRRVKADFETISKALQGSWREGHLFELKQSKEMYDVYRNKIAECDVAIEKILREHVKTTGKEELVFNGKKKSKQE